jgi:phage/plasmid-like protein (TIGR03299 family)
VSASIFGKRFLSTREPAWHGVGKSWTGPKTAQEAVEESGVGQIVIGTRRMGWQTDTGEFEPCDDRVVIVRYPTPDDPQFVRLGEASSDYTILQNTEIGRMMDASGLTRRFPVETCGALGKGETLFICLDMGDDEIAGEAHKTYALITDKRDGGSALQMLVTKTRVVCANTLSVALNEGEVKLSLHHNETIGADFAFGLKVMEQMEQASTRVHDALERLARIKVTAEDLPAVWTATYPDPAKGTLVRHYERVDDPAQFDPATLARLQKLQERWQVEHRLNSALREAAAERYDVLRREFPVHDGTALGVLNAVAEVADHTRNGRQGSVASLYGWRAEEKVRAYRHLLNLE